VVAVAELIVTATTDDVAWQQGIDRLIVTLGIYTGDASLDAAELISAITKGKLAERQHGPLSFSPSPYGSPPAMVSGDLLESVTAARSGGTSAMVGPTGGHGRTGDYARIQELGGDMEGHPYMRFIKEFPGRGTGSFTVKRDGSVIFVGGRRGNVARTLFLESFISLAPRPYLKPATDEAVDSGRVRDIYARYWAEAIEVGAG
jgi:hypothetical protein